MLRRVALVIATGMLIASCALTEPLPPAGTVPLQIQVQNNAALPAELTVSVSSRPIPGAVEPPTVPPRETVDVVFHVPMASNWEIQANGQPLIERSALRNRTGVIKGMGLMIDEDGGMGWWCNDPC